MRLFPSLPVVILSFATLSVFLGASLKKSTGSHPSSTGAPGDSTCSQFGCHVDAFAISGDSINSLYINQHESILYEADSSYELDIQIRRPGGKRYGFEIVALDKNDSNCGILAAPVSIKTPRVQIIEDNNRVYGTHTQAGITPLSAGYDAWQMVWTAPHSYNGPVSFYYATMSANGNNTATGDYIYLSSKTIYAAGTGVSESKHETPTLQLSFGSASSIDLHWDGSLEGQAQLCIVDLSGRLMLLQTVELRSQRQHLELQRNLAPGAYIVRLRTKGELSSCMAICP